jgi:hypothetical protein
VLGIKPESESANAVAPEIKLPAPGVKPEVVERYHWYVYGPVPPVAAALNKEATESPTDSKLNAPAEIVIFNSPFN